MKYIRDNRTGALLLRDSQKISEFCEKQSVSEQINALKIDINTLKQTVQTLQARLDSLTTSA